MKKIVRIVLFALAFIVWAASASAEEFKFAAGSSVNVRAKKQIEKNISALLTELKDAHAEDREPDTEKINIYKDAAEQLANLWRRLEFLPIKATTISRGREGVEEVHVMIPVLIKKNVSGFELPGEARLSLSVENDGTISGLRMGMLERDDVAALFYGADTDHAKRLEVATWLDDYYSWFLENDISSLAEFLCGPDGMKFTLGKDDGKRLEGPLTGQFNKIVAALHDPEKYILKIDGVSLDRHPSRPDIYGLTFRQTLTESSSGKSSSDWMFLLWDFDPRKDETMIPVRIVQPDAAGEECGVSLDDFTFE